MPPLATALFDYELPPDLIAQAPAERRDGSRLLVVDRAARSVAHHAFSDLPVFLRPGDTLFRNNVAVLPARLRARRPTGAQVECLLLRPEGADVWQCLLKPGRRMPVGSTFGGPAEEFTGAVVAKETDGTAKVRFTTRDGETVAALANRLGDVPLPPYIDRRDASLRDRDLERYQTVYADRDRQLAVAAPTAGLHFTPELLATLAVQNVRTADITLHVGLGTFKPISTDTIESHAIHREYYEIEPSTQKALTSPLSGRRVAVGTTSVRAIEDFLAQNPPSPPAGAHRGEASVFIFPPCGFKGVDALITNFHQPRSTLLCLVAAFLSPGSTDGIAWLKEIYSEAVLRRYRFLSYGDAMLIL